MNNASFWLTLIMLVAVIMAKDVYVCGLERNFNFKPQHIIQEVPALHIKYDASWIINVSFCRSR